MLSEPSEACDFGRTRISFHKSKEQPSFSTSTSGWYAKLWRCKEESVAFGQWTKEGLLPTWSCRDGYVLSAADEQLCRWEGKRVFGCWWRTAKNTVSWGEEGGTGGKRGCLVYNPEQKAALATNCASYVLYLNLNFLFLTETRIRFHSRGKKCGPEVLVPVVTCKKKKKRSGCYLSSVGLREQVLIHLWIYRFAALEVKTIGEWTIQCILKIWWIYWSNTCCS